MRAPALVQSSDATMLDSTIVNRRPSFEGQCVPRNEQGPSAPFSRRNPAADCKQVVGSARGPPRGPPCPILHEVVAGTPQPQDACYHARRPYRRARQPRQGRTCGGHPGMAFDDNLAEITDRKLHYVPSATLSRAANRLARRHRGYRRLCSGWAANLFATQSRRSRRPLIPSPDPRRRRAPPTWACCRASTHRQGRAHPAPAEAVCRANLPSSPNAIAENKLRQVPPGRSNQAIGRLRERLSPRGRALLSISPTIHRLRPSSRPSFQFPTICKGRTLDGLLSDQDPIAATSSGRRNAGASYILLTRAGTPSGHEIGAARTARSFPSTPSKQRPTEAAHLPVLPSPLSPASGAIRKKTLLDHASTRPGPTA